MLFRSPYFPWPKDPDEFFDQISRMTGMGNGALGRIMEDPLTSPPTTEMFSASFGAFTAEMHRQAAK